MWSNPDELILPYMDSFKISGSYIVCDQKDGTLFLLKGKSFGEVWIDERVLGSGIYPCIVEGKRVNFSNWLKS